MTDLCDMYQKKLPVELECGLHLFLEVMNGKWKLNLIWCIYSGIKRPGELQRRIPKASRRLLDTQLKQLTDQGIITKTIFDQRPAKVEYALTALGESLIPVIEVTARWGEDNREVLEPLFQSPAS
ncbi:winged helix-turn-helix transcriptional regulator [Chitinophaga pinensis]|uniref:Transcriptional regulator, HxlR family n=1 Tax=Chitinophaga pinensis (strain ATCC 43595 / DSM 2588 / LMG 13176 / NBRC 15968 / NCIMB 11800 / UQM 2034) TaxID=485918 RepID=A0A979H056_CHIPD|nr:helix-turn-helix domain-containing protein [Chitinophaga pinensis]ACU63110.1 transcriptional regulator, HxlR family [Chitinophaga pinensis DSM 2588]